MTPTPSRLSLSCRLIVAAEASYTWLVDLPWDGIVGGFCGLALLIGLTSLVQHSLRRGLIVSGELVAFSAFSVAFLIVVMTVGEWVAGRWKALGTWLTTRAAQCWAGAGAASVDQPPAS